MSEPPLVGIIYPEADDIQQNEGHRPEYSPDVFQKTLEAIPSLSETNTI